MMTAVGVLAAVAIAGGAASAHDRMGRGPIGSEARQKIHAEHHEKRADVQAAITAGDYAQFKELVGETGPFSSVTEAQFPKLLEMVTHLESAKEIANELGLKGPGHGMMADVQ